MEDVPGEKSQKTSAKNVIIEARKTFPLGKKLLKSPKKKTEP